MSNIYKDPKTDEWHYPDSAYILSETDARGIIIYANALFCEIAGYSLDELLGQPHSIVRHPDMPRAAFKGLWDDVETNGFWTGFVVNRRKDTGYYWVYSTVLRRVDREGKPSYLSIRTKPTRNSVEKYTKLYAELKDAE
ncbi:MAG: PAS domain-containing protein [Campylobacterales bacterium]|nr:PAS domain-containing protein [Campylobacterales bacterium]